ncbi:CHAT domain-containing protein [Dactylosporangium sp. NPDC051541]|uniref:CHAT domain-containing protein n=1 Tax=Dactylosporangium sp. NPDC051541 TaxID=3363977 RepID=UPI0037BC170D
MLFAVTESTVRLAGAGEDVAAAHGGVRPGLVHALHDVRRERIRAGEVPLRDLAPAQAPGTGPGLVSLRRAGELLAESFLPEPVASTLRRLVERATREFAVLRVGVEAPGLAGLPWEALPDPVTGRPLALHPHVVVYRCTAATAPALLAGPLRIVVAIASPDHGGGPLLDYEHELRAVLAAVRQARQHAARVEVVPFATTAAIRAALDVPGGVHVLHISAHGKPGALILEDATGAAREVTVEQLMTEAVPPGRMPPVLALAACYTDVAGEEQGTSFAGQLAARGVCAVIGTQTSVSDRYATLLFAKVYAELAASPDPDVVRAVGNARRLVQEELAVGGDRLTQTLAGMDEWGVVTVSANAPHVKIIDHRQTRIPAPTVRGTQWGQVAGRPAGQFVGRRALQRDLPAVLAGDEGAGLVLHGIGGIGKTTLAAEVLRRTVGTDPAWQVVPLYGVVSPDVILAAVAAAARREQLRRGIAPSLAVQVAAQLDVPWPDRLALLRDDVLDDVPLLVVLDNFEDNLDPATNAILDEPLAAFLTDWVTAPGRSRLLITSRHPIGLPGGAEVRLRMVPVGPMSAAETGKLLWSLPNIDRHATTTAVTERVWRVVGGHPRSLEYLDALLGHGHARFDDITTRLTTAVEHRLGAHQAEVWLAQDRTLEAALAHRPEHRRHQRVPRPAAGRGPEIAALLTTYGLTADQVRHALGDGGPLTSAERDTLRQLIDVFRQPPPPPYTAPGGLAEIVDALRESSLIHLDTAAQTVFMHRWTATELHHRWQNTATLDAGKDPIRQTHQAAAAYWRWRFDTWPQETAADIHDLHEARHHYLVAGDLDATGAVTEHLCLQLQEWGAWDQAAALIHDALRWLPTTSPRYPAYTGTLGNLAYLRGDYAEAERRHRPHPAPGGRAGPRPGRPCRGRTPLPAVPHDQGAARRPGRYRPRPQSARHAPRRRRRRHCRH